MSRLKKASVRLRKPSKNALWWAYLFGSDNQLLNILAMVVAILLLIVVGILIAATVLGKSEFFLEASRPVLALIATIIAFIIGQKTGPSH
jgi:nucleoside recognition membrane protein YjiH